MSENLGENHVISWTRERTGRLRPAAEPHDQIRSSSADPDGFEQDLYSTVALAVDVDAGVQPAGERGVHQILRPRASEAGERAVVIGISDRATSRTIR
jgi:hypothetical protein